MSEILSQTYSILYKCDDKGDCVFESDSLITNPDMMASGSGKSYGNASINDSPKAVLLQYLKQIGSTLGNMYCRISGIDKRLDFLEDVKTKVNLIGIDLKSLKVSLNYRNRLFERLNKIGREL